MSRPIERLQDGDALRSAGSEEQFATDAQHVELYDLLVGAASETAPVAADETREEEAA